MTDVAWISLACSEWHVLAASVAAQGLSTVCIPPIHVADDMLAHTRLLILDNTVNQSAAIACKQFSKRAARKLATQRIYYIERHTSRSVLSAMPVSVPPLSAGCHGYIHPSQQAAQRCAARASCSKGLRHVHLDFNTTTAAAKQVHAFTPPDLLRVHTWSESGSCRGNEPFACVDGTVNMSRGLAWQSGNNPCFGYRADDLAKARVAHVSAAVLRACDARHASCPFVPSTWSHIRTGASRGKLAERTMTPRHKDCAVVGSGPSARGYDTAIDRHEAVLRFNDAPTDAGQGVGTRTTYRITSCKVAPWQPGQDPLCQPEATRDPRWHGHMIWRGPSSVGIGTNHSFWQLRQRYSLCVNSNSMCSTGMWGVAFALTVCDAIDLYGYGPVFDDGVASYGRYYGTGPNASDFGRDDSGHTYFAELAKIHALHCAGYLHAYGQKSVKNHTDY